MSLGTQNFKISASSHLPSLEKVQSLLLLMFSVLSSGRLNNVIIINTTEQT